MERDDSFNETQRVIRQQVLESIDLDRVDSLVGNRFALLREVIVMVQKTSQAMNRYISKDDLDVLSGAITDEILGFGPLRELLEDETVNDILVNGPDNIFVERRGKLEKTNLKFLDNEQLTDIAKRLVAKVGRRIDESQPLVDARLQDGSRLNVVMNPVSLDGTSISIRKFSKESKTFKDLIAYGTLDERLANFLIIAGKCRANIVISGGTGSGKTTLLNALSQHISSDERILTLEDAAELRLQQPHVVRLETKMASIENTGKISMRNLVMNALRMRPDRIIVGECRGEEAFEMLQAMNTGHDGSMTTLHANTPRDAVARLENMVMMAGLNLPVEVIRRNIASAVNLIIQVSRMNDGSRKIMNVSEVMGVEGDVIVIQDIFSFVVDGERDSQDRIVGKFVCHGLSQRSALYAQARMMNLEHFLKIIFER